MLSRFLQKIFGENGPTGEFGQFGSDSAGSQVTTKDPDEIQNLDAYYGQGLFSATNNHQEPSRIEDINGLYFLFTRQLAYIFQAGIAEWQADTEYFADKSIVLASDGGIYIAKTGTESVPNKGLEPSAHGDNWKLLITKDGIASGNPPSTRTISAGNGLSGGGDLSANRSFSLNFETLASNIKKNGAASVGTTTKAARSNHVHPTDTSRAPINHASSGTGYGIGTTANYGHNKVIDTFTRSSHVDGEAASSYAAHLLKAAADSESSTRAAADTTLFNSKAPNSHASSSTGYGIGTAANYGHNKVINDLSHSSFANGESLSAYQGYILASRSAILPVGFMYIQFKNCSSPSSLGLSGTWTDLTANYANRYLAAAGSRFAYGTDYNDGLPNIVGAIKGLSQHLNNDGIAVQSVGASGAFSLYITQNHFSHRMPDSWYSCNGYGANFYASRSSGIYGAASFVRPATTVIKIWQRTA